MTRLLKPIIAAIAVLISFGVSEGASKSILFTGKLDKNAPSVALEQGSVTALKNMKRPSPAVPIGWERRAGTTHYNTTPLGAKIDGIFQYKNNEFGTDAFFTQSNNTIYLSSSIPPGTVASFGTGIYTVDSGTSPAFGEKINDDMIWASKGTTPWAYSGASAYPDGFLVSHETGTTLYADGWDKVRDKRTDTNIVFVQHSGNSEFGYVGYRRRLSGFYLDLLSTNVMASGLTISARRSGAWVDVSNRVDGTASGVTTLYQSGHVSWDASELDEPYLLPGTKNHLYWYRTGVTADVTDGVKVSRVLVNDRCEEMTNLWSGLYDIAVGCMLSSATGYQDYLGEITDGTDVNYVDVGSLTTTYALYVGFVYPAFGIKLNLVNGYTNVSTALTTTVSYWSETTGWTTISSVEDFTDNGNGYALGQSGMIQWDGSQIHENKRSLGGSLTPLYWYKLTWSATVPADVRIWEIAQAQKPETIPPFPKYDGVIESNGYAVFWPSVWYDNGLDFAQMGYPHIMNGPLRGSSGPIFGPGKVNSLARISDYIFVSTEKPYRLYLLEGKVPGKWDSLMVSGQIGSVGPHTMLVVEDAIKRFSATKTVVAAVLMDPGGVYLVERVPIKISDPIAEYWDTTSAPYIEPAYAYLSYAWIDYLNNIVCFAVPMNLTGTGTQTTNNVVLPYNYITDEWYDMWVLADPPAVGASIIGSDDQRIALTGTYNGYIDRMNSGDSDYTTAIEHYLTISEVLPFVGNIPDPLNYSATLRSVKTKSKSKTSGDIEVVIYPDGDTSGVTLDSISLINSGKTWTAGRANSNEWGESFSIRFRSGIDNADEWLDDFVGFTIEVEPRRETQVK